jgi:exopolysaccharide biosynthesis predicted pyruvyltransferase EpsI
MWDSNLDMWKEVWAKWPQKDFIVGPTTIRLGFTPWDEEIRRSQPRLKAIFARDPDSYAILQRCELPPGIVTGLSHDPALYLRGSEFLRLHRQAATGDFVLAAFRDDHEAALNGYRWLAELTNWAPAYVARRMNTYWKRANYRKRIAQVVRCTHVTKPLRICDIALCSFQFFLETVRCAAEVHTDRLHCMLLAAMLDKPTFAYPTAYGKLEAVYAHSVKEWAHVEFAGGAAPKVETNPRVVGEAPPTEMCRQPAL